MTAPNISRFRLAASAFIAEGRFSPECAILYLLRNGHAVGKIAYDASRMESTSKLATF